MSGRDIVCGLCLINGRNFNFSVKTLVSVSMSRPQRYVVTSNGAFHLKTSCNIVFFAETSFVVVLTNPCCNIKVVSQPHLCLIDVTTSEWCCSDNPGPKPHFKL